MRFAFRSALSAKSLHRSEQVTARVGAMTMASLTVRNVPDDVHRRLRERAAQHGQSMEAEVRGILQSAVKPPVPVKLGSLLAEVGRQAQLTHEEFAVFERLRSKPQAQ
jgi:plasmid stability protein